MLFQSTILARFQCSIKCSESESVNCGIMETVALLLSVSVQFSNSFHILQAWHKEKEKQELHNLRDLCWMNCVVNQMQTMQQKSNAITRTSSLMQFMHSIMSSSRTCGVESLIDSTNETTALTEAKHETIEKFTLTSTSHKCHSLTWRRHTRNATVLLIEHCVQSGKTNSSMNSVRIAWPCFVL